MSARMDCSFMVSDLPRGAGSPSRRPARLPVAIALLGIALAGSTVRAQTAPEPVVGSTTIGAGVPTSASPDGNNKLYSIDVYYFNADGSLGKSAVTVPGIPVTAGLPNPTAAQIAAARAAKASAIVAAINAAKLNGVTAAIDPKDPAQINVAGVRQSIRTYKFPKPGTPGTYLGPAITRSPGNRVTGEIGDTQFNFRKGGGGGGGGGSSGSMYRGSLNGPGTGAVASGIDGSGFPSVIGFGFIDNLSATPVNYTTSVFPTPGMTESDILGSLASAFTQQYAAFGYTATYDRSTNILSIDQPLPPEDPLWSSNSDTTLDLMTDLISVPEPASALLLPAALATLLLRRRR